MSNRFAPPNGDSIETHIARYCYRAADHLRDASHVTLRHPDATYSRRLSRRLHDMANTVRELADTIRTTATASRETARHP